MGLPSNGMAYPNKPYIVCGDSSNGMAYPNKPYIVCGTH